MKKFTIILPVHKIDDTYKGMYEKALTSIKDFHNDVIVQVVAPSDVIKELKKYKTNLEIVFTKNSGDLSFPSQMNLGITNTKTEWFSILEIDDVYLSHWLKTMNTYIDLYPNAKVFLPIVKDVNLEGKLLGFTNESVWAYGFSDIQGLLDNETLLEYQNYQTSGGIFHTETVKEMGMFKDNFKLTFVYEFLLRLTHHLIQINVVPMCLYQHVNLREDSLFWLYKHDDTFKLTDEESFKWVELAKKEMFFKIKRDLTLSED